MESTIVAPSTAQVTSTGDGGNVVTLTSVVSVTRVTSYQTVAASSTDPASLNGGGNNSNNGFFDNTGAVAGVFVVVGLAVAALIIGLGFLYLRRKRARELDEDIRVAVGGAGDGGAGTSRFRDEDDDEMHNSDGTHGDPFANGASSSGYGSGVPMMAQYNGRGNSGYFSNGSGPGNGNGQGYQYPASNAHSAGYEPSHQHSLSAGSAAGAMGMGAAAGAVGYGAYDAYQNHSGSSPGHQQGNGMYNATRYSGYGGATSENGFGAGAGGGGFGQEWQEYVQQYGNAFVSSLSFARASLANFHRAQERRRGERIPSTVGRRPLAVRWAPRLVVQRRTQHHLVGRELGRPVATVAGRSEARPEDDAQLLARQSEREQPEG